MIDSSLKKLANPHIPDKLSENVANDKHMAMLEVTCPYARDAFIEKKSHTCLCRLQD